MNTSPNVRIFAPERWGQVDKFKYFYEKTHVFKSDVKKAVRGIDSHFFKALLLRDLAVKHVPSLDIDSAELQERGVTPGTNSQQFSALIEGVFTELYSSIDCSRKVIVAIFKRCQGIPDSTRKLFERAVQNKISDFPYELSQAFIEATWYDELRDIRDELTHSDIGTCHLDSETKRISYMHFGLIRSAKPLVIDDVLEKLEELIAGVNQFLGRVFHYLNTKLNAAEIDVLCGFFHGRGYQRKLALSDHIDFHSGECQSKQWFDADQDYRCPFAQNCGAYTRTSAAG